jgi:regulator of protease activity HflC (stomatin/prohibitin superfamily)
MRELRIPIATLALLASTAACTNPRTPEGHEGYVFHKPLMFGKAEFRQTLKGPASTGVSWRLSVINIDMRAKSYQEDFRLLTGDNLQVQFEANTRIGLRPGSSREIVDSWGEGNWYEWNVKEPLRTLVRREVTEVSALDIQLKTEKVRQKIYERLVAKYEDTPIKIESVDIGNIQFPKEVTDAIALKIAKQQELERQEYLLQQTEKEAAIRVLEALKAAKQQMIISSTLDPLYVQRMAIQTYKQLAESPNNAIVVLPNSAEGTAMPLVLSASKRKELSPADERLLEAMENRYMTMARHGSPGRAGATATPAADSSPPQPGDAARERGPAANASTATSPPGQAP